MNTSQHVKVIDSHTGGEPTRIVIEGGPDLGNVPVSEQLQQLKTSHDSFRSAVVNEPRGSDVLVGALLGRPTDSNNAASVIFFNNVGYLGMCGHGTIGLIATLAHLGRIKPGKHNIETPVGTVTAELFEDGRVSVENVPSYRYKHQVEVDLNGHGLITGDIAWGGNWFFLVNDHGQDLTLSNADHLIDFTWRIRQALEENGITGKDKGLIDHIELFTPSTQEGVNSKNFVLCPGKAYDRSPCGTGTSAKLACMFADGTLKEGDIWRQESIIGSVFEGSIRQQDDQLIPTITGTAHVNAEATLILNPSDPFCHGIQESSA